MVKFIIDLCSDKFIPYLTQLQGSFLILNESCDMPEKVYSYFNVCNKGNSNTLSKSLKEGNFFFRTSSELERGIIIGLLIIEFPNARVFTNRQEVFTKCNSKLKISLINREDNAERPNAVLSPEKFQNIEDFSQARPKISPKLEIAPRPYDSKANEELPKKREECFNKASNESASLSSESGPRIGEIRHLIDGNKKNPLAGDMNAKNLHDSLDPIIRHKLNQENQYFNIKVFENEPDLRYIFESVMKYERIKTVNKFFQVFGIVHEIYSNNIRREQDDLTDLKKIISAFFEYKIIDIKNPAVNFKDLFSKNCWNIEVEYK